MPAIPESNSESALGFVPGRLSCYGGVYPSVKHSKNDDEPCRELLQPGTVKAITPLPRP